MASFLRWLLLLREYRGRVIWEEGERGLETSDESDCLSDLKDEALPMAEPEY